MIAASAHVADVADVTDVNRSLLSCSSVSEAENEINTASTRGLVAANKSKLELSIVIPVYDQETKVSGLLGRINKVLNSAFMNYELIVVNDGSNDNTLRVLREEEKKSDSHLCIVSYVSNRGKGYAVKQGVTQSRGNVVLFIDADLEVSPEAIKDYVKELENYDLVIASKAHPQSEVNAPIIRKLLSRIFNLLVRTAVGIPLKDTQAGLKAGNGEALRTIFKTMLVTRFAFDVEMLTIANYLNLNTKEMPITVNGNHLVKVSEIARMLVDIIAISYRYRIKRSYQKQIKLFTKGDLNENE
jgi:dolichol-phosphate mannosyltransferase